jgi:hypothetical protein
VLSSELHRKSSARRLLDEPAVKELRLMRAHLADDAVVLFRVRAEFAEMPGLKLTLAQASRLFHLDAARCERVLTDLVDTGQLVVRDKRFVQTSSA